MDHRAMKLGKSSPRHDARTLMYATYRTDALAAPPTKIDWSTKMPANCGMMLNDSIGDCAFAGIGHQSQCWTSNASVLFTPSDADVEGGYETVTGYNPKDPSTDQGTNLLDSLGWWKNVGMAGHKIGAYVAVEPTNKLHVKEAIDLFGGVYIGVALPLTAQQQAVWSVVHQHTSSAQPNSWGGHCIVCVGYDASYVYFISWGKRMKMTWSFWLAYVDEVYAPLSTDWITKAGKAPSGFDLATLTSDLAAIK